MAAIQPHSSQESIEGAISALAAEQHGVFSRAQALSLGSTDAHLKHAVARGRYVRLRRGVFATAGRARSFEQRVMIACLARSGTVASHRAAARLWRLAGVDESPVELTTSADRRGAGDMIVYRTQALPDCDVTRLRAIPVTTPTRTLIDLAAVVDEARLEIALDDALRRGLTSVPRLQWRLTELGRKGRDGTATMKRLIAQRTSGPVAESPLETRVVRALRKAGLPAPTRQHRILHNGKALARVDLAWPAQRVALEVESYRYHSGRREWEQDLARRNSLEAAGWKVVHVTARQLATGGAALMTQLSDLLSTQGTFFGEREAL